MRTATDTIVAIASPPGGAERGIVRASGPGAAELVRRSTGLDPERERWRRAWRAIEFHDGVGTQPGYLAWMPGPRSLTGEDVAEFHLPGNPHLLQAALARLLALGARAAGRGEFTRRAFLAGKLDLARAEGVLVLVAAENESERRAGSALLAGGLSTAVEAVREELTDLRALCEASLDFDPADTGHVPLPELLALGQSARAKLAAAEKNELARPGEPGLARIVLAGRANAGKSLLFNALTGGAALVSAVAGTTRDPVVARVILDGEAFLVDTAGSAPIERLGFDTPSTATAEGLDAARSSPAASLAAAGVEDEAQSRARTAQSSADLLLWVADAARTDREEPVPFAEESLPVVLAWNKLDLPGSVPEPPERWVRSSACAGWVGVSGLDGRGQDELRRTLARVLGARPVGIARELAARHAAGLATAGRELDLGLAALGLPGVSGSGGALEADVPLELAAEHLREASRALDDLTGTTTSEALLDRIFARFCLGK